MKTITKTTTKFKADQLFEAVNENGNRVLVDLRPKQEKESQSPTELLLSALAGCIAIEIVPILKKRKKTVNALTIEVEGDRNETNPRYFTKIRCLFQLKSPDAKKEEVEKIIQLILDKYCSVASSLKAPISFTVQVGS